MNQSNGSDAHPLASGAMPWHLPPAPEELTIGLREIAAHYSVRFADAASGTPVSFRRVDSSVWRGWRAFTADGGTVVEYAQPGDAFRALGVLMGQRLENPTAAAWSEEQRTLTHIGNMLDVSRNAVLNLPTLRSLIRSLALLGVNWLMLYTEDTYEVPGEPLFGYFRGRYSQEELRAVDDYAALFGIEVVPCIQTLGHLGQLLRWSAYAGVRDTSEVLLAGEEATYKLIEKMLAAASAPFRSRRVHIGMDEAHGIGTGNYRLRNGYALPFDILTQHLQRVTECCERLNLQPFIWSDMYFRLGSKSNAYYDKKATIPPEVSAGIPAGVELVYWDYYHRDENFYHDWISRHLALGKTPIFAAGIWTWSRFWAALPHSFSTLEAGMKGVRQAGLQEAFITLWGDDGTECDLLSALPAIARFADLAYGREDRRDAAVSLRGATDFGLDDWMEASRLDCIPSAGEPESVTDNYSKWFLWHDPVLRFLDRHIPDTMPEYYRQLALDLKDRSVRREGLRRLEFPAMVADVLAVKLSLHADLATAYTSKDPALISKLLQKSVPQLAQKVRLLWQRHRVLWHELNKPFGWEVIERRYGTLLARLETLRLLLDRLESDPAERIEEFEERPQVVLPDKDDDLSELCLSYAACSSPSVIF